MEYRKLTCGSLSSRNSPKPLAPRTTTSSRITESSLIKKLDTCTFTWYVLYPDLALFHSPRFEISASHAVLLHEVKRRCVHIDMLIKEQIPKPDKVEGLGIEWPMQKTDMDKLKALHAELKSKI